MFHMVNEFGNAHKIVPTERKRDELIAQGWRVVEENIPQSATTGRQPPLGKGANAEKPPRKKAEKTGDAE